jgi:hypothetical protein
MGYAVAWLLGVPLSLLLAVWVLSQVLHIF